MYNKKIGAFIQEKRIDAKITQEELARKMHVSIATIDKWEKGKSLPNIKKLEKLSIVLGTSIVEMLSGDTSIQDMDLIIKKLKFKNKIKYIIAFVLIIVLAMIFICF
ncbi:MAG: helix-turn-helix transcriptional regulator [Bacilli bacterium]|nr:helix-turn-helix transcriptional regulator [Bacilli bacterium]